MLNPLWYAFTLVTLLPVVAAAQTPPAALTKKRTATPTVPQLDDATVAGIQRLATAEGTHSSQFFGLSDFTDGRQKLYVISNRALIAWNTAKAAESGGRFRPSRDQRGDVVAIDCGDEDIGEQFECSSVRVTANGRLIKPVSYKSGINTYHNAFGAVWKVREVTGTYPARLLASGFTVDYTSPDGSEWTLEVSAEEAESELLLSFDAKRYVAEMEVKEKAAAEERASLERQEAEKRAAREDAIAQRPDVEIARLSSPSAFDRLSAAQWFAESPTQPPARALPALVTALSDREWGVQVAASRALQRMGPAASEACASLAVAVKTAASNIVREIRETHRAVCGGE